MSTQEPAAAVAFDVRQIPFSYRGSWLGLSPVTGLHTLATSIHLVSHRHGMHPVLRLEPTVEGRPVPTDWHAEPHRLTWDGAAAGRVEAAFDGPRRIRLRGCGLGLRLGDPADGLTPFTGSYLFVDPVDDAVVLTSYETGRRVRMLLLDGGSRTVGAEALGRADRFLEVGADGAPWEISIEETSSRPRDGRPGGTFDDVCRAADAAFGSFADAVAPGHAAAPAARLASYVIWSATVAPEGFVRRESVLMSKHWMDKVWSWDHCFNALALAPGAPDLAVDQLLMPFDHQEPDGSLPDSVAHSEVLTNYVKPPVHGWALHRLRRTCGRPLTHDELVGIHDALARWTRFWLTRRRRPGHVLPYYQHGNDSGWDNATTFDRDRVVEAPDLAAFLVLQLEELADLAGELGLPDGEWRAARDELLAALTGRLWNGTEFVAVGALSGRPSTATSLLNLLPLVLGRRLPADVLEALAGRVQEHLTEHGLATEPVTSEHYASDGYWRGPIWAPSTALIVDGLAAAGFADLARTVRQRFLRLCEASGFAENFDARTGDGLRDRAYTWTAAVYLLLAADEARDAGEPAPS